MTDKQTGQRMPSATETTWLSQHLRPELDDGTFDEALTSQNCTILAIGESSHGTSEHMKTRFAYVRKAVECHGYRTLAIEASRAASVDLDAAVRPGAKPEALSEALSGLQFWTWHVEEARQLFAWIRSRNRVVSDEDQVRVVGIDPQLPGAALVRLQQAGLPHRSKLKGLRQRRGKIINSARELAEFVGIEDEGGQDLASYAADLRIGSDIDILQQGIAYLVESRSLRSGAALMSLRDRMMADEVARLAEVASGPVILLAHNVHIGYGVLAGAPKSMGWHLRERYGEDYIAIAQLLGQGRFLAKNLFTARLQNTPKPYAIALPEKLPLVEHFFRAATGVNSFLHIRDAAFQQEANWTRETLVHRAIAAVIVPILYKVSATEIKLGASFDGCIYHPQVTPAAYMPRSRR